MISEQMHIEIALTTFRTFLGADCGADGPGEGVVVGQATC